MNRPETRARPEHSIRLDSGEKFLIRGSAVLGRKPALNARVVAIAGSQPLLIRLEDPLRVVSRVHLILGDVGGTLWVQDMGSRNGSILALPDGRSFAIEPGNRYAVEPGSIVRISVRWFRVEG